MSIAPARVTALKVLSRVRKTSAYSAPVLANELHRARLSPVDAALATRLVYGTLAAEGVLDEVLDRHVRTSLEPRVRDVLRIAAYELLFSRAPAYAVVDQAVLAAQKVRLQAGGLVNAIARKVADDAQSFPWGDPCDDRDALARSSAHPRWIVDLVLDTLGESAGRQTLASGLEPAPTYVRLDPLAADPADTLAWLCDIGAGPRPSPPDADCLLLESPAPLFQRPDRKGFFAMDAAAQMAPVACSPKAGLDILNLCAGRGNKTLCLEGIARRGRGDARITAVDSHPGKVETLRRRLAEHQASGITAVVADATAIDAALPGSRFDVVLLDAPCTGLGTLRRYPEKRWRLRPEAIDVMAELQKRLFLAAGRVVRPGGRLVYSTCSIAPQENAGAVRGFLGSPDGRDFAIEPVVPLVPEAWAAFVDAEGCFQSWPAPGGPDGHYVAVLRRSDE